MRPIHSFIAAAGFTLALAPTAHANGEQACAPAMLAIVDAWLSAHPFLADATSPDLRADSACKAAPQDPAVTIVAAAYARRPDPRIDDGKNFVMALVDTKAATVRAAFKGTIAEDAVLHVSQGGLRLDTARYELAPGVRAFGVDVSSDTIAPRCVDAWPGPTRTLFVQDGSTLRPVLAGFLLSQWQVVSGEACGEKSVGQSTHSMLAVSRHATHGYADLVSITTIDDSHAKPGRLVMRYDGRAYRMPDPMPFWQATIAPEAAASAPAKQ
ncbi:MAG: hypothetical protein JO006_07060 [Paucibacter sp.]|nr:hypothetical protein [Roseateles sp.]